MSTGTETVDITDTTYVLVHITNQLFHTYSNNIIHVKGALYKCNAVITT